MSERQEKRRRREELLRYRREMRAWKRSEPPLVGVFYGTGTGKGRARPCRNV